MSPEPIPFIMQYGDMICGAVIFFTGFILGFYLRGERKIKTKTRIVESRPEYNMRYDEECNQIILTTREGNTVAYVYEE